MQGQGKDIPSSRRFCFLRTRAVGFLFLITLALFLPALSQARGAPPPPRSREAADSLMRKVFSFAQGRDNVTESFGLTVYVRHTMRTKRRGVIMRYVPGMFRLEKGTNDYFGESLERYQVRATGEITKKTIGAYTTMPYLPLTRDYWVGRYSLSVYSTNLFSDRILSPLNRRNRKFYRYRYNFDYISEGRRIANIEVVPKFPNTQLVAGSVDVDTQTGKVKLFDFRFIYGWGKIHVQGEMGEHGKLELLPVKLLLESRIKIFGNRIDESFEATADYDFRIPPASTDFALRPKRRDLTKRYMLITDTAQMVRSRLYFDSIRPYPLLERQKNILDAYSQKHSPDTLCSDSLPGNLSRHFAEAAREMADTASADSATRRHLLSPHAEDVIFGSHDLSIGKGGVLKIPPMLTPSMLQWSKSKGFALQARLRFSYDISDGEGLLETSPRVGYNFKQRQVYWSVPFRLQVFSASDATIGIDAGGGDHMYSINQAREVRNKLENSNKDYDSLLNVFDSYEFYYYRDSHVTANFSLQPVVGLTLAAGLRFHHRTMLGWNSVAAATGLHRTLTSIAPRVHVAWTPAQYYYRNGYRRIPLQSHWPTFMLDYERGIRVKGKQTHYERIEFDSKYTLPLYALRSLYFRVGCGFYTLRGHNSFFDYDYFRNSYMPSGWDDEISGQFQLLDSRWYNESRYYYRISSAYESPLLVFSRIPLLSKIVRKERIYVNLLHLATLGAYGEWGYGVSTHWVDLAAFVAVAGKRQTGVGGKIVLRLFD